MSAATEDQVSIHIEAASEKVYDLVSDVTRMGEWSPETHSCEWIDGATGPTAGARFKARNKRGLLRWSNKPKVVAAEPGREFAFSRTAPGSVVVWRYRMEPEGSGTKLTESYEVEKAPPAVVEKVIDLLMRTKDRAAELRDGMRQTLGRIKAAAESSPPT